MVGDSKSLPRAATTIEELGKLSSDLHDWWLDLAGAAVAQREFRVPLQAEGLACEEADDWSVYRVGVSTGEEQWEAPPTSYGALLIVRSVAGVEIESPDGVTDCTLVGVHLDRHALTIQAEPKTRIVIQVSGIDVLADSTEVPGAPT